MVPVPAISDANSGSHDTAAGDRPPDRIIELDGLRGIAILLVMWHHFPLVVPSTPMERWFVFTSHFGWAGVDLFFVLSGFLITGILLDSRRSARYFTSFYARRVLRIFPLYYLLLIAALVVLPLAMSSRWQAAGMATTYDWTYWFFLSNIGTAFENAFQNRILAPVWSLAIEEQFYIAWPLVVLVAGPKGLRRLCPLLMIGSFVLRLLMLHAWDFGYTTIYVFTPCRLDGLAAGAWVATLIRTGWSAERWKLPIGIAAFAALSAAYLGEACLLLQPDNDVFHRSAFGLVPGISLLAIGFGVTVCLLVASSGAPRLRGILCHPILRSFGKYSYAIYLTHMPMRAALRDVVLGPGGGQGSPWLEFSDLGSSPWLGQAVFYLLATSVAWFVGWLSWHLYESWFLQFKRYFPY